MTSPRSAPLPPLPPSSVYSSLTSLPTQHCPVPRRSAGPSPRPRYRPRPAGHLDSVASGLMCVACACNHVQNDPRMRGVGVASTHPCTPSNVSQGPLTGCVPSLPLTLPHFSSTPPSPSSSCLPRPRCLVHLSSALPHPPCPPPSHLCPNPPTVEAPMSMLHHSSPCKR